MSRYAETWIFLEWVLKCLFSCLFLPWVSTCVLITAFYFDGCLSYLYRFILCLLLSHGGLDVGLRSLLQAPASTCREGPWHLRSWQDVRSSQQPPLWTMTDHVAFTAGNNKATEIARAEAVTKEEKGWKGGSGWSAADIFLIWNLGPESPGALKGRATCRVVLKCTKRI